MKTRRRWTETAIETEVAPIVAELGRMPTRRELADRGVGGAWSAMQRHGGLGSWRARLSRHVVAQRAYYIAQERGGGDPVANWLAAERELLAA